MKRKHGSKKSKSKKRHKEATEEPVEKVITISDNAEENFGAADIDNEEVDSRKEVEATAVVETDQPEKITDSNPSVVVTKPVQNLVYGRMKVKFKSSKVLDSQVTATDATDATPVRSDTDMSSQQVGPEKTETSTEKIEESENSLPDKTVHVSGNPSKKAGSIKIKTSRNPSSSVVNPVTSILNPCTSTLSQNEEIQPKEPGVVRDPRSDELELKTALEIIKKIMKMDAAEPFNVPVNPIALGIPDYFDVIDTPMDFGTICSNLESGFKYKNAEDVYKDVEYVWNNCYKYNNKGDYVVELMKRVKKNFTKYWMAAGLYGDHQPQGSSGADVTQPMDAPHTTTVRVEGEGGHVIHKKRAGFKGHKDDCLCAICKMMRKRRERERSISSEYKNHMVQQGKLEGQSPAQSPYQDTSSNMGNSSGPDVDSDMEGKEELQQPNNAERQYIQQRADNKDSNLDKQARGGVEVVGTSQLGEGFVEKSGEFSTHREDVMLIDSPREQIKTRHEDRAATVEQNRRRGLIDKNERAKILEKLQKFENPLLLGICENIFNNDRKSVWSGPHSLVSHQDHRRTSSIHEAISSFMN